jgi:hypothetical protein
MPAGTPAVPKEKARSKRAGLFYFGSLTLSNEACQNPW